MTMFFSRRSQVQMWAFALLLHWWMNPRCMASNGLHVANGAILLTEGVVIFDPNGIS